MELPGRVAVVTGGAVRIGRAVSLALSQAGMRLCLHYGTSEGAASQTARLIRDAGGDVVTVQADLSQPAQAARVIMQAAQTAFGQVDVLVNNAAIFEAGTLADLTQAQWDRHQAINLTAPTFLCREFARLSAEQGDRPGSIVNVVDWRALRPQPGHLAYTLSKAGLVALTQILAQELAPTIRVNAIAPGAILPPPGADARFEQRLSSVIPLRHTGSPADITAAVLYLLQADFVTGEILQVTGGQQLAVPQPSGQ